MAEVKERRAKIFRNGRSRAVLIPAEFDLNAEEVILRQLANGEITISPMSANEKNRAFQQMLQRFAAEEALGTEDEFPHIDEGDMLPLDETHLDASPGSDKR